MLLVQMPFAQGSFDSSKACESADAPTAQPGWGRSRLGQLLLLASTVSMHGSFAKPSSMTMIENAHPWTERQRSTSSLHTAQYWLMLHVTTGADLHGFSLAIQHLDQLRMMPNDACTQVQVC